MIAGISNTVATPGFLALAEYGADFMAKAAAILKKNAKVDFIVGDPKTKIPVLEDGGYTMKIPMLGAKRVYAKVDGRDLDAETLAMYPEYPILTFLLASEY